MIDYFHLLLCSDVLSLWTSKRNLCAPDSQKGSALRLATVEGAFSQTLSGVVCSPSLYPQSLQCEILRVRLSHYHPVGTPKSVIYTRDRLKKNTPRKRMKYVVKVFPLFYICAFSFFFLRTYPVVAMVQFQFGIAGEWLTWRPCREGQALAAIKLTCLRYQVLCFLTM